MNNIRPLRDATKLLLEARPVCEAVVVRTSAAQLFAEHHLTLTEARRLQRQLGKAIEQATVYKRKARK